VPPQDVCHACFVRRPAEHAAPLYCMGRPPLAAGHPLPAAVPRDEELPGQPSLVPPTIGSRAPAATALDAPAPALARDSLVAGVRSLCQLTPESPTSYVVPANAPRPGSDAEGAVVTDEGGCACSWDPAAVPADALDVLLNRTTTKAPALMAIIRKHRRPLSARSTTAELAAWFWPAELERLTGRKQSVRSHVAAIKAAFASAARRAAAPAAAARPAAANAPPQGQERKRARSVVAPAGGALPLEPSLDQMHDMMAAVSRHLLPFLASLPAQPASDPDGAGAALAATLTSAPPRRGQPIAGVMDALFRCVVGTSANMAGPGHMAYIPGGGVFASALAETLAAATNRYTGLCFLAPAMVRLEVGVLRWICNTVGFPREAFGFLTSGASLATFSAVFTARRERLPDADAARARIYVSTQAHHANRKAALLCGFPAACVVAVAVDSGMRMEPDALRRQVKKDVAAGRLPFMVIATAGTTNTGAVDPLEKLARVASAHSMWFHVDAAYGGFYALTVRGRAALQGLHLADSVVLDAHKSLFLPYGTGCLVVRDGMALQRAHHVDAGGYVPPPPPLGAVPPSDAAVDDDGELFARVDFSSISPEMTRPARGLNVWLPLQLHGVDAFAAALDEKLDLIDVVGAWLRRREDVVVVGRSPLTMVAFFLKPRGAKDLYALNERLLAAVVRRKRVLLSGTTVAVNFNRRFVLRVCVNNFRTHRDRVDAALEDIAAAIDEVTAA
jgi:aromatic-L-amino-acid decarboxylase